MRLGVEVFGNQRPKKQSWGRLQWSGGERCRSGGKEHEQCQRAEWLLLAAGFIGMTIGNNGLWGDGSLTLQLGCRGDLRGRGEADMHVVIHSGSCIRHLYLPSVALIHSLQAARQYLIIAWPRLMNSINSQLRKSPCHVRIMMLPRHEPISSLQVASRAPSCYSGLLRSNYEA